jgi:hypothetical protein
VGGYGVVSRYGPPHRRLRNALAPHVAGSGCVRCGLPILPGERWDLDHDESGGGYLGAAHSSCNRSAGGRKSVAMRRKRGIIMRSVVIGADIAWDRSRTAVVVAGWTPHPDSREVIAVRLLLFDGPAVAAAVQALRAEHGPDTPVVVNGSGSMRVLADPLKQAGAPVHEATAQDMADAHGRLIDSLRAGMVKVPAPHPELTRAVQHAKTRSLLDGEATAKRDAGADLAPLVALELAVWRCLRYKDEDYDVMESFI